MSFKKQFIERTSLSAICFLVSKKDGGQRPNINQYELNQSTPYCHFKMEGLNLLKEILEKGGDYLCKLDLKDAYFCVLLNKKTQKNCEIRMERHTLRVSLPLSWTGPSINVFHKTFENPTNYSQETQYQGNNLLRRLSDSGETS